MKAERLFTAVDKVKDVVTEVKARLVRRRLNFVPMRGEHPQETVFHALSGGLEFFIRREPHDPEWFAVIQRDDESHKPIDMAWGFAEYDDALRWCLEWT